jgi:phosphodiesterase/alkaline phosphatase D-like protein
LHAATEKLDFFGFLGDTVYADGSRTVGDYRAFWDSTLATEGMLQLTSSTSLVVTWDDHEVDNNWDIRTLGEARYAVARGCFDEAFPRTEGPGGSGIWRVLRWGTCLDVFVLDGRAERQPEAGLYLSAEQLAWLVDGLQRSTARFKIVFNSVPITDLNAIFSDYGAEDRWDGFPVQRAELLRSIADVSGVLFVAGDVHYAQVGYVDPAGGDGAELMEVFTGPAGSFANVAADLFVGDPQYVWLGSAYNWCRFECDPVAGTIRVTHIGDDGAPLHDITLVP